MGLDTLLFLSAELCAKSARLFPLDKVLQLRAPALRYLFRARTRFSRRFLQICEFGRHAIRFLSAAGALLVRAIS